MGVRFDS
jgi:hypothetical protein